MSMDHLVSEDLLRNLEQVIKKQTGVTVALSFSSTNTRNEPLPQEIEKQLTRNGTCNPNDDSCYIPVVSMMMISPNSDSFNWRDYYIRTLATLSNNVHKQSLGE